MNLQEKKELAKAFSEIQQIDGDEVFKDPKKVLKYLGDLMPNIAKKDKFLLEYAIECDAFENISKANSSDMYTHILAIAQKMEEDYGSKCEAAFDIIDAIAIFYGKSDGSLSYREKSTVEYTPSAPQQTNSQGDDGYKSKPVTPPKDNTVKPAPKPVTPVLSTTVKTVKNNVSAILSPSSLKFCLSFSAFVLLLIIENVIAIILLKNVDSMSVGILLPFVIATGVGSIVFFVQFLMKANDDPDDDGFAVWGVILWIISLVAFWVLLFVIEYISLPMFYAIAVMMALTLIGGWRYFHEAFGLYQSDAEVGFILGLLSIALLFSIFICLLLSNGKNSYEWYDFRAQGESARHVMLQFFSLIIGKGFWMPEYYAGLHITGPMINLIFYTVVSVGITSTILYLDL